MSNLDKIREVLSRRKADAETPPLERRGLPTNGLNHLGDAQDMVATPQGTSNRPTPLSTTIAQPLAEIIQPGRMSVSPVLARRILDEANYDRQRGVYKSSLRDAEKLISGDDWIDNYQIWFARVGSDIHLVDGQHRLSAIWTTGASRTFTVEVLDCESIEDAHTLYARMDRFGRKRTDSEMLNALHLADNLGVGKLMAKAAWKAAPYLADDFKSGRYGKNGPLPGDKEKVEFLTPWSRLIKRYDDLIALAETDLHRALMNPGIVALALLTLRDQPLKAVEFWEGAALNDGLRRGDPRHTLIAALRNRAFRHDGREGAKTAAVAWNAHYEERRISFIRVGGDMTDMRIAGVRRLK